MKNGNSNFYFLLAGVWLIILGLWAIIGVIIVPIEPPVNSSDFMIFVFASGKVFASLILVLIWLIGWYKALIYMMKSELFLFKK